MADPEEPAETEPKAETEPEADADADAEQEALVAALPAVEELGAGSDYTPFLDRRVPVALRRAALRKLWLSNPMLAGLDGLNDYDDDFRTLGVGKLVRTAYQIGKGMVRASDDIAKIEVASADEEPVEEADEEADETKSESGDGAGTG